MMCPRSVCLSLMAVMGLSTYVGVMGFTTGAMSTGGIRIGKRTIQPERDSTARSKLVDHDRRTRWRSNDRSVLYSSSFGGRGRGDNTNNNNYNDNNSNNNDDDQNESETGQTMLERFSRPTMDEPVLPMVDVFATEVIAPISQVAWLSLFQAPAPSWLKPVFHNVLWQAKASWLLPTLLHGTGLACCWLVAAVATNGYARESVDPSESDFQAVVSTLFRTGAYFAILLVAATQMDILLSTGPTEVSASRMLESVVEVLDDTIFVTTAVSSVRLLLISTRGWNERSG